MNKKYIAFIPVRGGSKSIPLKNIKPIGGRPLVCWTVEAACACKYIETIFVATDSEDIKRSIRDNMSFFSYPDKIKLFDRDPATATDTASTESAMIDFAERVEFNDVILIQATSPLLEGDHLEQAIEAFEQNHYDSLLSVVRQKRFIWGKIDGQFKSINYDYRNRPRRQEFDGYLVENGAFYITNRKRLLETQCRLSGKIGTFEMDEETYFEIDEPSDWTIVEHFLSNYRRKNRVKKIKMLLTDCDGVLTDGGMYYSENGDELKKFNTRDGMGIAVLRKSGVKVGIITGEDTQIVVNRGNKMQVDYIFKGICDKLSVLKDIAVKEKISLDEIAYIGDDINDIECLRAVGVGFTVPVATQKVKDAANIILDINGGEGVVRVVADWILENNEVVTD